jgi:hypothetical protein
MVDVSRMPANAFGYVPTPAIVAPIEFTLKLADYSTLGGHMDHVRPLSSITSTPGEDRQRRVAHPENPWPLDPAKSPRPVK